MHTPGLWQALHERRYLRSGWPWRCALYFLTSAPLGAALLVCLLVLALAGSLLTVVLVGVPLLLMLVLAGLPVARLERRRLRLIDPAVPMADAHRDPPRTVRPPGCARVSRSVPPGGSWGTPCSSPASCGLWRR